MCGWRCWIPASVVMLLIAWLSHQPSLPSLPGGIPDWVAHGLEFAVLARACLYGATQAFQPELLRASRGAGAWWLTVGYGGLDEWHQSFVGRDMALSDWLADAAGATIVVAATIWSWRAERRRRIHADT